MARDSKANSAYDSGIRGSERPRGVKESSKTGELLLPNGGTSIEIRPAANGFVVSCSYPPKKSSKDSFGWRPPEPYVFADAEQVAEYIEKELKVEDKD